MNTQAKRFKPCAELRDDKTGDVICRLARLPSYAYAYYVTESTWRAFNGAHPPHVDDQHPVYQQIGGTCRNGKWVEGQTIWGELKGEHRGVPYVVGPRTPCPGIGWVILRRGYDPIESHGAFYDDAPEGAFVSAEHAVQGYIDSLVGREEREAIAEADAMAEPACPYCGTPLFKRLSDYVQVCACES
jgi:hypothetical protein